MVILQTPAAISKHNFNVKVRVKHSIIVNYFIIKQ